MTLIPAPDNGSTVGTIDMGLLSAPAVIETLDYEALLAKMLARLAANDPAFTDVLESDPAAKVLEAVNYVRMLDRQRVNEAAKAVMLAYATGTDLDHLGLLQQVARLQVGTTNQGVAIMEADDRYKRRIRLAAEGHGAAGSSGTYVYWALTLATTATDASASYVSPGAVWLAILGPAANGQPPTAEVDAVRAALNDEWGDKRPLTDALTVAPAQVVSYAINAAIHLLPGPDANLIVNEARAELNKTLETRRRLGFDMPRSAILAALHRPGVAQVNLISPAADVVVTPRQVAIPSATPTLTIAGRAY